MSNLLGNIDDVDTLEETFEKKTKIEFDQDFVLIWEITTKEGDTSPVLLNIDKIIFVKIS